LSFIYIYIIFNNFMVWVALGAEVSVDASVVGYSFFREMSFSGVGCKLELLVFDSQECLRAW